MTPPTGSYKTDPHYLSRLDTTPSDLRVLKTLLRSVFKIHKDPHARSMLPNTASLNPEIPFSYM